MKEVETSKKGVLGLTTSDISILQWRISCVRSKAMWLSVGKASSGVGIAGNDGESLEGFG